jgi:hypothetical protein
MPHPFVAEFWTEARLRRLEELVTECDQDFAVVSGRLAAEEGIAETGASQRAKVAAWLRVIESTVVIALSGRLYGRSRKVSIYLRSRKHF